MRKLLFLGVILFFTAPLYCYVDTISNESGMDITIQLTDQEGNQASHMLVSGDKKIFNREDKCIYQIKVYTDKWKSVADVGPDDVLVIPETWNRCQNWDFTIKKRLDGSVYVARKKGAESEKSLKS